MSTESSTSSSSSDSESGYESNTGHGNHRGGRGGGGRIHSSSSSASGSDSDYCSGSDSDYGSGSESSSSSDSYSDSGYGSESGQGDDRCRRVGGGCIDSSSNNGTKRSGSSTTGGRGPGNAAGSSCTVGPSGGGGGGGDNNAESVYWPGWEVVGDDYTCRILDEGFVEVTLTKDKGVRAGEAKGESGNDKKSAPKRVASSNSSGANGVKHVFGNDFVPCGARFKFPFLSVVCEEKDCSLVSFFAATTTWEGNGGAVQLSIFPGRNAPHLPNGDVFGQGNDPRNSRRRHQQKIFKHLGAVHPEQKKEHARKLLLDPKKSKDLADKDMRIRFK